jgi:lipid-binding SYLF domain-containing protein
LLLVDRAAARSEEETVRLANEVLKEFLDLRVKQIPASLLAEAHGVAIIPNLVKVGLVVGGQHGKGVIVAREADGSWRAPMFISLTGGSIGWQVGAQATDIVLVFKTQKSVEGLMRGKFTLGADAAVAAGPVGRRTSAATDAELKAEIYSYSRSRGLFAGLSIDGSSLQVHDDLNAAYYGPAVPGGPPQTVPESALQLVQAIARLCSPAEVVQAAPAAGLPPLEAVPTPATPRPQPMADTGAIQAELARSLADLNPLLDEGWQRYLAMPAEVYQRGRAPAPDALLAVLKRFDAVAQNPQYRSLQERREFQTAHGLLRAYYEALAAAGAPKLSLPPPPSVPR